MLVPRILESRALLTTPAPCIAEPPQAPSTDSGRRLPPPHSEDLPHLLSASQCDAIASSPLRPWHISTKPSRHRKLHDSPGTCATHYFGISGKAKPFWNHVPCLSQDGGRAGAALVLARKQAWGVGSIAPRLHPSLPFSGGCSTLRDAAPVPSALTRQVPAAEGMSLASRFGCLFYEVSACQDFAGVQHVFHEAVREVRRQAERSLPVRPLFITEERPCPPVAMPVTLPTRHGLASCTFNTLSTVNYKEIPSVAQAKLVTVKSSRAQSKRKAPTLTLLKGFKIF